MNPEILQRILIPAFVILLLVTVAMFVAFLTTIGGRTESDKKDLRLSAQVGLVSIILMVMTIYYMPSKKDVKAYKAEKLAEKQTEKQTEEPEVAVNVEVNEDFPEQMKQKLYSLKNKMSSIENKLKESRDFQIDMRVKQIKGIVTKDELEEVKKKQDRIETTVIAILELINEMKEDDEE